MGIKFILTESQLKRLVKNLDEVAAGYDDFNVMGRHGGKSITILVDTAQDLSSVFKGILNMLMSENIEYIDLKENLIEAIDLIDEINLLTKTVFKDFTDKKTIMKGEIMHRKLESYQEKIRTVIGMGEELLDRESLMEKLYDLTDNVLNYVREYTVTLLKANKTFMGRLEKGRPTRNPDMN